MTDPQRADAPDRSVHSFARPFLWLDKPFVRDVISLGVVVTGMILLAIDIFVDRHGETALAERPGFYAIIGFIGLAMAVLACWPLRALLLRRNGGAEDGDA